jgi:hypothetical protein
MRWLLADRVEVVGQGLEGDEEHGRLAAPLARNERGEDRRRLGV